MFSLACKRLPFVTAAAAAVALLAGLPAAADRYVEPRVSLGLSELFDIEQSGIGTGARIGRFTDGALVENDADDLTAGVAIAAGWQVDAWSLEAELGWRYRTDWDVAITTPSISSITNVHTNVGTTTAMLNTERRWRVNERWVLNVGLGVGIAYTHLDSDYIERAVPGSRGERRFNVTDDRFDLAVSGNAGLTRQLGTRWQLSLRYRYIDFGDLEIDGWAQRSGRLRAGYTSHELLVGLSRPL